MAAVESEKMVAPTPTSVPPISQSMDAQSSSGRFSGDMTSALPTPGVPDLSPSSTPSPSRQLDSQSQPLSRVEEYRQLFRLPSDEVLIQDFNCALQENFLLQGHMYLFAHYICFYSNLFGFETKKIIPFHEVTSVRRAKAVAVFPTAIEILAAGKKYFFTSFLSRDEAFKLINEGWLKPSTGFKEILDQQEPKPDVNNTETDSPIVEESGGSGQSFNESDIIGSDKSEPILEDSKHLDDVAPEIVSMSTGMQKVREQEVAEAAPTMECSSSTKSSAWESEDVDAPVVPECYTKVAESKFPIGVEEFFNMFFSDDAVSFHDSFHRKSGDKDFKCTPWRPHEKFGHTREVSFQHPIKLYLGARFGSCCEVQKYRVFRNSHLIVDTSQAINDVPYGDYFTVEGRWDIEKDGDDSNSGCILRVYINVAFSKKTMWRGKIVQSTVEECREAYAIWIDLAHQVLKQKNLEKEEGPCSSDFISNGQVQLEKQGSTQHFVDSRVIDARISHITSDPNQRVADLPQGNISVASASVRSVFQDTLAKLFTSLKYQNTPPLLLVVTITAILLLMQISILVLLSRPQRIHVIPHAECMSGKQGVSDSRAEVLSLVNKQMKYLKEEMHFVETLLEKMQYEHAQLKQKLKDLELFRNH